MEFVPQPCGEKRRGSIIALFFAAVMMWVSATVALSHVHGDDHHEPTEPLCAVCATLAVKMSPLVPEGHNALGLTEFASNPLAFPSTETSARAVLDLLRAPRGPPISSLS